MDAISFANEKTIKNNLINLKNIVFEVTEKCNLNCKYCGLSEQLYQKYEVRKSRDLPFKKAQLMIDYLQNVIRIIRAFHPNHLETSTYFSCFFM